jgi:hypothetical protein
MSRALPLPALFALILVALGWGCAAALKTPPDLIELAGTPHPPSPSRVDALLLLAEESWRARSEPSVRDAVQTWLQAAAADPGRTEGLRNAVRGLAWLIEHGDDPDVRRDRSVRAVQAAQWCQRITPDDPECSYWIAVALGLQARERRATGLDALPRIEKAFLDAAERIPDFERAGPDRALALFYVRAPGWPKGPGDPDLGREHAARAVQRDGAYAPNHLALAEAQKAVDEIPASRESYGRALRLAQESLARSEPDAAEWVCDARKGLGQSCED